MIIKSPYVRRQFYQRLMANIRAAFKQHQLAVRLSEEGGIAHVYCHSPETPLILSRIFGIKSYSLIEATCPSTLEAIVSTGNEYYRESIIGKSFAIRAQRSGKHPFSSLDVQIALGSALKLASGGNVKLKAPDRTIHVHTRGETTYFYSASLPGPGGFPLGSEGRALCLLSGGFDSAVAAWLCQKRGIAVDYVFFNLAGAAYEHSVLKVAKHLNDTWSYGSTAKLHIIDFNPVAANLRQTVQAPRFLQVILKRSFYRAACRLAGLSRNQAIITGEAIGQVSSQTLPNLATIEQVASMPVLRPLLCMDKDEIIAISRRIGTFELTKNTQEFCQLTTEKPATACKAWQAEKAEEMVAMDLLTQAVENRRVIALAELSLDTQLEHYIFVDTLPPAAVLIDCRSKEEYESWHPSQALHHEFSELSEGFTTLPATPSYVIFCALGVQSAIIAEKMQARGYQAYSFKGGSLPLKNYLALASLSH